MTQTKNSAETGTHPERELPSRAWTIVVTILFGIFGAIPAALHAGKAARLGQSGARYWKAFWVTFAISLLVYVAVVVAVVVLVVNAVNDDSTDSSSYSAPYESLSTEPAWSADNPDPEAYLQLADGVDWQEQELSYACSEWMAGWVTMYSVDAASAYSPDRAALRDECVAELGAQGPLDIRPESASRGEAPRMLYVISQETWFGPAPYTTHSPYTEIGLSPACDSVTIIDPDDDRHAPLLTACATDLGVDESDIEHSWQNHWIEVNGERYENVDFS